MTPHAAFATVADSDGVFPVAVDGSHASAPPRGIEGLLFPGISHRWLLSLSASDLAGLAGASRRLGDAVACPCLWEDAAQTWSYTRHLPVQAAAAAGASEMSGETVEVPWRAICTQHDRIWHSWRGAPKTLRVNFLDELRHQRIADLEVLLVEFIAGEEALALGHSHGVVSVWELVECDNATKPLHARVLGVFHTTRSYDVQDLSVWPSPLSVPAALALGHSIWLAAAVGTTAFIWESTGSPSLDSPRASLARWTNRGALRHRSLFLSSHFVVWSVRLCHTDAAVCRAVTISEDRILRAWRFGGTSAGEPSLDGEVLWQCDVGDARQAAVALLPSPRADGNICDEDKIARVSRQLYCAIAAVARADQRSLELLDIETGTLLESIGGAWPPVAGSLPQTALYDTRDLVAAFSSITESGDGTMACVHIGDGEFLSRPSTFDGADATLVTSMSTRSTDDHGTTLVLTPPRVWRVQCPLAGVGRVLRQAIPMPVADAILAVVHEGDPLDLLEVWERKGALGEHAPNTPDDVFGGEKIPPVAASAQFRARVPPYVTNPRLMAVGGRRLALLDPTSFLNLGELRVLEWRPRRHQLMEEATWSKASRLSRKLSWLSPSMRTENSGSGHTLLCGVLTGLRCVVISSSCAEGLRHVRDLLGCAAVGICSSQSSLSGA
eukprot:TRINITY_DN18620_c0_g2_i1.p1 TRINITY_DN18620_c0_g2~~TRINITY_DN18620_c0_g2_i1.p1  ORF type:complete len:668 (+),score=67.78 TRINITY_DN18620_c0_g2_i1:38-2041(+)